MLVKDGQSRFDHWKIKYDVIKRGKPIRKLSEESEQKLKAEYLNIANIENETKKILGDADVPIVLNFSYQAFAREIYGLTRRFAKTTLNNQVKIVIGKWQARSLKPEILEKIKDKIFTILKVDLI
ncbi:MAG: hypothetical protein N2748_02610 [candidate division WOR-3 bacterium]|nr:hypothetical protein [candidate division WOR-3 bacterium]